MSSEAQSAHADTDDSSNVTEYKNGVFRVGYDEWHIPELTDQALTSHQTAVCECGAHSANYGVRYGTLCSYTGSLAHTYRYVFECEKCDNFWIGYV